MEIVVRLDVMLALRKMKARELAAEIGITEQNLSLLRTGKVKGVRFETLARICEVLDCQPVVKKGPGTTGSQRKGRYSLARIAGSTSPPPSAFPSR
jgi:putative transcriptional regulator